MYALSDFEQSLLMKAFAETFTKLYFLSFCIYINIYIHSLNVSAKAFISKRLYLVGKSLSVYIYIDSIQFYHNLLTCRFVLPKKLETL